MKLIQKEIFKENTYQTRDNSRIFLDKVFLNTRIYFVIKYLKLVFKNRKTALKGLYNREKWALSSYDVFKLIEDCGGKFFIEGLDNIKNCKETVVFISNHMSAMESMIFPCLIAPYKEVTFVVKESLAKHFLFGPVMRARKPITVGRLNSREDLMSVIQQGKDVTEKGVSVVIFPQGSRKEIFKASEFNSLGVKLAKEAKVNVIPVALKTDFWGNGKLVKDLGPIRRNNNIHISFGEPIEIKGNGKKENNLIIDFIEGNLMKWNKKGF